VRIQHQGEAATRVLRTGPSERFQDFVEGSGLLKQGYSFVMVDLRGFGGSNGCLETDSTLISTSPSRAGQSSESWTHAIGTSAPFGLRVVATRT
jgi:pimeloyl-ACP methyl ester carboxylesterase